MALTMIEVPYEHLTRFNPDGTVKGMQAQTIKQYFDNGVLVAEKVSPAMSVEVAGNAGIPLADVIGDVAAAQQKTLDALTADKAALAAERDALTVDKEALVAERNTLAADLATEKAKGPQ